MTIIRNAIDTEYGPNNPEPQEMKDSAMVRDPEKDALHAALEYIDGGRPGGYRRKE